MKHDESIIQCHIVSYLQAKEIFCFAVPNENVGKNVQAISRAVSMGMRPGVSDLVVWLGSKTLYLEVKTLVGRQSDSQKKFQARCKETGREYHVVRSVDDVAIILSNA